MIVDESENEGISLFKCDLSGILFSRKRKKHYIWSCNSMPKLFHRTCNYSNIRNALFYISFMNDGCYFVQLKWAKMWYKSPAEPLLCLLLRCFLFWCRSVLIFIALLYCGNVKQASLNFLLICNVLCSLFDCCWCIMISPLWNCCPFVWLVNIELILVVDTFSCTCETITHTTLIKIYLSFS